MYNFADREFIKTLPNHLELLIEKFPEWNWHYEALSDNPNITLPFVIKHRDKPWNWYELSKYLFLTMKDVLENKDLPWVFSRLILNSGITFKDILENYNLFFPSDKNSFLSISSNLSITMKDVLKNSTLPWSFYELSHNPVISIEDVLENIRKPWDWHGVSGKPLKMQHILNNPNLPWNWEIISQNPSLPVKELRKFFKEKFTNLSESRYFDLRDNPSLTLEDVLEDTDALGDLDVLSRNTGIKFSDIKKYLENNAWNMWSLSRKRDIVFQDVLDFPKLHWEFGYLTYNPNFKIKTILDHPEIPFKWRNLSRNPSITFEDVISTNGRYIERKIDYDTYDKPLFLRKDEDINIISWSGSMLSQNLFYFNRIIYDEEMGKAIAKRKRRIEPIIKILFSSEDIRKIVLSFTGWN